MRFCLTKVPSLRSYSSLRSLFWLISEKAVQIAFSAISVGLIARTLGVDAFGDFQYVLSVLFVFSSIALLVGSEVAAPILVEASSREQRRQVLGSLFGVRLIVAGAAFLALIVWAVIVEQENYSTLLAILALSLLITEPFNVFRLIREVQQNTRIIAWIRIASSFLKVILVYILYRKEATILAFALLYSAEYFFVAFCYFFFVREEGRPWNWKVVAGKMIYFVRHGFFVWLGVLSMMAIQRLDRVAMEGWLPSELYGQYAAALNLVDSAWFFGPVAVAALAPSIVYRDDSFFSGKGALKFLAMMMLIGLSVAIAVSLFAPFIVPLIFGRNFQITTTVVQVSIFILIPGFAALSLDAVLVKSKQHRMVTLKWLAGLIVALSILFMPWQGMSWERGPLAIFAGYLVSFLCGLVAAVRYFVSSRNLGDAGGKDENRTAL